MLTTGQQLVDKWLTNGVTDVEWPSMTRGNYSPPLVSRSVNHATAVVRWITNGWSMVTVTHPWGSMTLRFYPFPLIRCHASPLPPDHARRWASSIGQDTISQPLSDALHILAGKLSKASRQSASDNRQLTAGWWTPLGCQSLMDWDFICLICERSMVRNKIIFPSDKSTRMIR